jgi:hypothetical protein
MGGTPGVQSVARAELWAAVTFAESTEGTATIYIDASYVVKGWEAGREKTHTHHHDLWSRLWDRLGTRKGSIKVVKVKAHRGEQAAKEGQDLRPFILNEWADQLAGEAALRHEIFPIGIEYLRQLDDTTWKVQRRIARVTKYIAENPECMPDKEERQAAARVRKKDKRDILRKAFRDTKHVVTRKAGGKLHCTVCRGSSTRSRATKWLGGLCQGAAPKGVHFSHKIVQHQGLSFCSLCGRWSARRIAKLGTACGGKPVGSGIGALLALGKGKLPQGLKAWPKTSAIPAAQPAAESPAACSEFPSRRAALLARIRAKQVRAEGIELDGENVQGPVHGAALSAGGDRAQDPGCPSIGRDPPEGPMDEESYVQSAGLSQPWMEGPPEEASDTAEWR